MGVVLIKMGVAPKIFARFVRNLIIRTPLMESCIHHCLIHPQKLDYFLINVVRILSTYHNELMLLLKYISTPYRPVTIMESGLVFGGCAGSEVNNPNDLHFGS